MGSEMLELAKKHEKQKKWKKAIECYEEYMKLNLGYTEKNYASYAKCLRMTGQMNAAKEVLHNGLEVYPKSESILSEFFNLYDYLGEWNDAKLIANNLIDLKPEQGDYYFLLGRTYSALKNNKKAAQTYKIGLTYKHGISFESLIQRIQKGISIYTEEVKTNYIFISGKNNLGAMIHEYRGKKYFTKISRLGRSARREKTFYKEICDEFPILKEIVPLYVDSQVIDKILYLTIEMIDKGVRQEDLNLVIETSQKIATVSYQDIVKKYPNPNYAFSMKSRAISIVIFFTKIHEESHNRKLFSLLKKFAIQRNYPKSASVVLEKLETLIMSNRLYFLIKPDIHYSLLHGDFIPANMQYNQSDESLKVFDWATFVTGPHFLDIARYSASIRIPYSELKKHYLFNDSVNKNLSLIEQIFFLYAFILCHFVTLKNKNINLESILNNAIYPALTDMENCVSRLKEDEFASIVQSFQYQSNEISQKNLLLKKENEKLTKEVEKLKSEHNKNQNKLNNVINSKSWRLTAPLRKLMEKIKM